MKHNMKITLILLAMFVVTQLIGLYVVNFYSSPSATLPGGLDAAFNAQPTNFSWINFAIAFVFSLAVILLLIKFHSKWIIRIWMFLVVITALMISFGAFFTFAYSIFLILFLSIALAILKVFRRDIMVHNFTELLIYPGIAVIFVPLFNVYTIAIVLVLISIYDIYAVWHSGFMQKMAKYQIEEVQVFSGFFVPYLSKKQKQLVDKIKIKYPNIESMKKSKKLKGMKVSIAILGGGDVVFPIITSGVVMLTWGLIPALIVTLGATLALCYLFFVGEKKKFYPAMPYITTGIFIGIAIAWIVKSYLLG